MRNDSAIAATASAARQRGSAVQAVADVSRDGHVREERELLEDVADAPLLDRHVDAGVARRTARARRPRCVRRRAA